MDLGMGASDEFSIADARAGAGIDYAVVQQIHATAGRNAARAAPGTGQAHRFSCAKYPVDGWQQAVAAFERIFHRLQPLAKNRFVRYAGAAAFRTGAGSSAGARNRPLQKAAYSENDDLFRRQFVCGVLCDFLAGPAEVVFHTIRIQRNRRNRRSAAIVWIVERLRHFLVIAAAAFVVAAI